MREVDDAHDAEHERKAAGDQGVIAAKQNALNDLVDENQGCGASARDDVLRPKYASVTCSRLSVRVGPSITIAPSSMQMVRLAVAMARFRSCSTKSMATPEDFSASSRT